jgi:branched-chain amino acid aminotransferase
MSPLLDSEFVLDGVGNAINVARFGFMSTEVKATLQEEKESPREGRMIWANGAIVSEREAFVSPFDHGLLTGDGVFETLGTYGGRVFAMRRHYARLQRSAAGLGLEVPEREVLERACDEVLKVNELERARVRITITGGEAPLGSEKGNTSPTVIVAGAAAPAWPETGAVVTVPFTRNENGALVGMKTTSYGENVVALAYAKERGGDEAIFGNTKGQLCEGTGSNIFIVESGEVLTPPLSSGCLAGITRELVLEICVRDGIEVREEDLTLEALLSAEEAFLTSSTREVQAIGMVDGRALSRAPGKLTLRLASAFSRLVVDEIDP